MSTEKFHEISEDTQAIFDGIISNLALPFNVKFKLISNSEQKFLIKLSKVADVYSYLTGIQMLAIINEAYVNALDEKALEILIQQELDRIEFNMNSGAIKIRKPELSTSVGVIKKYGIDEVARANKLEELYTEQKDDKEKEDISENAKTHANLLDDNGVDFLN